MRLLIFLASITATIETLHAATDPLISDHRKSCITELRKLPILPPNLDIEKICGGSDLRPQCHSTKGAPIFHFDFNGADSSRNILVFSVTHGDEHESGTIALRWMQRLSDLKPRNRWRIVPILNPDGLASRKRMNANGVDLNRNFPSKDWNVTANKYWSKDSKQDPRKFPGPKPASEVETRCAMDIINDFRPDFIVSVHTPYGVLDFDGPKVSFPDFKHLPWVSLGTYPGSLGRYMWKDQNVPVLTIELKDDKLLSEIDKIDQLQDISGTVAIRATKKNNQKTN
jgi:protein MpaA